MKQKTPEQELELLRENILHERAIWENINENGCNDPFWADGCNMNLTRKHILSYRNEIANCCEKQDDCNNRCDIMDSYEYAEECEEYEIN